jgi:hypothetical protein
MTKKVIFVSNDYSFLPALKAVKKDLPEHFDFFLHSESENGEKHFVNLKRKSVMENILSRADYCVPVFTGLLGIYLTEILVNNLKGKKSKSVLLKDVIWQYVEKNAECCREDRTITGIIEKNTNVYASFFYFFLENKIPQFLKRRLDSMERENFFTAPFDFLLFVVEKILENEANGHPEIYLQRRFISAEKQKGLLERLKRKNLSDFFFYLRKTDDWRYVVATVKYLLKNKTEEIYS